MKKSQLKAVEQYLKIIDHARPMLSTIQKSKSGKQFILDGYTAILFKNYEPELDALKSTLANESVNIEFILKDFDYCEGIRIDSDNETDFKNILLWDNLKEYKKQFLSLYPESIPQIHIFDRFFEVNNLLKVKSVLGSIKDCYITFGGYQKLGLLLTSESLITLCLGRRSCELKEQSLMNADAEVKRITSEFLSSKQSDAA